MAILKKEFGVMPSGEKVYEYTLTNKKRDQCLFY